MAYPQPLASNCCCHVGPAGTGGEKPRAKAFEPAGPLVPILARKGKPPNPNSIITGTGPFASAGVVSVSWISTLIAGYDELSTCPANCFVIAAKSPLLVLDVLVTSQRTDGTFPGTRPYTSRSKSSTISGRLWFHHISGVVTRFPFFRTNGSGKFG